VRAGAQTRVRRTVSVERVRMEFDRDLCYQPQSQRPSGRGAFSDYDLAMARYFAFRAARRSAAREIARRRRRLAVLQAQEIAEERWDAEGGSQNFPTESSSWY